MHFYQRAASNTSHARRSNTNGPELSFTFVVITKPFMQSAWVQQVSNFFNKTNLTSLTLALWLQTTQNWNFLSYNSFLIITGNKKMTGSPRKSRACALILPLCQPCCDRAEKQLRMLEISISKSFDRPFVWRHASLSLASCHSWK